MQARVRARHRICVTRESFAAGTGDSQPLCAIKAWERTGDSQPLCAIKALEADRWEVPWPAWSPKAMKVPRRRRPSVEARPLGSAHGPSRAIPAQARRLSTECAWTQKFHG